MLPAAKAVAKELLPILDRPTIQYVVEEAAEAGVTDVILVSSPAKRAVEHHFQIDEALEERLRRGRKEKLLESVRNLAQRIRVRAVDQLEQRGLGHAVAQARAAVGDEAFLCMLGDAVFSGESPSSQLMDAHRRLGTAVIGLEEVPIEKVSRYGIIGGTPIDDGLFKINSLVEKPRPEETPSRLAIAARYVLTPGVFECLDRVAPGRWGRFN